MTEKTCKKCGHLCHCIEADHEGCDCSGCGCEKSKAEDLSYENNGCVVIDSTNDCEGCQ